MSTTNSLTPTAFPLPRNLLFCHPSLRIKSELGRGRFLSVADSVPKDTLLIAERTLVSWEWGTLDPVVAAVKCAIAARSDDAVRDGGGDDRNGDGHREVTTALAQLWPRSESDVPKMRWEQLVNGVEGEKLREMAREYGLDPSELPRLHLVAECNSFPTGLLPNMAMANHACVASARVVQWKEQMTEAILDGQKLNVGGVSNANIAVACDAMTCSGSKADRASAVSATGADLRGNTTICNLMSNTPYFYHLISAIDLFAGDEVSISYLDESGGRVWREVTRRGSELDATSVGAVPEKNNSNVDIDIGVSREQDQGMNTCPDIDLASVTPTIERRRKLELVYGFECECKACATMIGEHCSFTFPDKELETRHRKAEILLDKMVHAASELEKTWKGTGDHDGGANTATRCEQADTKPNDRKMQREREAKVAKARKELITLLERARGLWYDTHVGFVVGEKLAKTASERVGSKGGDDRHRKKHEQRLNGDGEGPLVS
ncbi:hypothetical protein HDU93_008349 [Gonapodya sp. JEL0774]|nr:hypothetical protein HDU93_008349 [Gonapodya sp. JEL0774]